LRICVIGKYPPIQGGVSARTYWTAHALAMRGHDVQVVTNAKEASPPFRMHMRPEDWARCSATYDAGSVTVHWTDPADRSQAYIPMASPFVSKLAAVAARVHADRPFDVILSHYLEPYGVAGCLAAAMTGVPHVARMAGSDAGRLWHHPQLELLYDHVLRSADAVIAIGTVAGRAIERGVDAGRIVPGGAFPVSEELFTPEGPKLDIAGLRAQVKGDPQLSHLLWGDFTSEGLHFGVYGKLGERKGSFALLSAMSRLKSAGIKVGLVALAHGTPTVENAFRERAIELGLVDRILQIPFLPYWCVPEFLRGCVAVCCLEQDFPIALHAPIIPSEVLMSGTCLVGSTEVIRKLPSFERLPHGYGCIAVENVDDIEVLSSRLAAIVNDPETAVVVGARGREFARETQRGIPFPDKIERILTIAAARESPPLSMTWRTDDQGGASEGRDRFPLTRLVAAEIAKTGGGPEDLTSGSVQKATDTSWAARVLEATERCAATGEPSVRPLALAVRIEIAIALMEGEADAACPGELVDPLFRLQLKQWAMKEEAMAELIPVRSPGLRMLELDCDVSKFLGAETIAAFPKTIPRGQSYILVFESSKGRQRDPLLVDELTARILRLSEGTLTVSEIVGKLNPEMDASALLDNFKWIKSLFLFGLVSLRDSTLYQINEAAGRFSRWTQSVETGCK
jgi:glycosyltransferase involved in cell wall biosynthesis